MLLSPFYFASSRSCSRHSIRCRERWQRCLTRTVLQPLSCYRAKCTSLASSTQNEASSVPQRPKTCEAAVCGWLPPNTGPSQRVGVRQASGSLFLAGHVGWLQAGHLRGPEGGEVSPSLGERPLGLQARRPGEAEPPTHPSSAAAAGFHPVVLCSPRPPHADDNSNQSSIADASPIKQENSSNSSPAPEPASAAPVEGTDAKADETQADGKELPGAEGMCPWGLGPEGPVFSQPSCSPLTWPVPCQPLEGHARRGVMPRPAQIPFEQLKMLQSSF